MTLASLLIICPTGEGLMSFIRSATEIPFAMGERASVFKQLPPPPPPPPLSLRVCVCVCVCKTYVRNAKGGFM